MLTVSVIVSTAQGSESHVQCGGTDGQHKHRHRGSKVGRNVISYVSLCLDQQLCALHLLVIASHKTTVDHNGR
jgi:hypothetical protein